MKPEFVTLHEQLITFVTKLLTLAENNTEIAAVLGEREDDSVKEGKPRRVRIPNRLELALKFDFKKVNYVMVTFRVYNTVSYYGVTTLPITLCYTMLRGRIVLNFIAGHDLKHTYYKRMPKFKTCRVDKVQTFCISTISSVCGPPKSPGIPSK